LFKEVGHVERADVFQRDGRSKGCGIVVFENAADANEAIRIYFLI
jgi:RNA recognition motif-containing protein